MATPVEVFPPNATVDALNGTTDATTGLPYIPHGVGPTHTPTHQQWLDRTWYRLIQIVKAYNSLRFARESDPGLDFGVYPGNYKLGGSFKTFAGATAQTLTNNATNYIYIDSSNALQVSTSAYPTDATSHVRIATVVCSGGDVTSVTDTRDYQSHVVPTATSTSDTGTNEANYTLDADNAGAGVDQQVRFNRGSTDGEDAALMWDEAADLFQLLTQHSTETLSPLNILSILISGVTMLDSNGAAKVAAAVAGNGLAHSSGVLSVPTSSAKGTQISGGELCIDPSDGITLDANGVAVALGTNKGLEFSGSAGSGTLGVEADDSTIENASGGIRVKDGGLAPAKTANFAAAAGAIDFIVKAQLVGGNTVAIFNADAPFKFRVIDAWSVAESADGGTWKIDNGANDIIAAVTVTGTDKTINRAASMDDAYHEVAASASLRVVGDGANADCTVYVRCMRVA